MVVEIATLSLIVSAIALVMNFFFNFKGNKRTDNNDLKERVERDTKVDMKLNEIFRVSSETRNCIDTIRADIQGHSLKLTEIEASVKSAHKRIDALQGIGEKDERKL